VALSNVTEKEATLLKQLHFMLRTSAWGERLSLVPKDIVLLQWDAISISLVVINN